MPDGIAGFPPKAGAVPPPAPAPPKETVFEPKPKVDGVEGGFHGLSHHENKPERMAQYQLINRWHVERFAGLLDRLIALLQLPISPDLTSVQLMALALVVVQEVIYVLSLHALAYWIFPRLNAPIPEPPRLLHGLVALDPL